MENPPPATSSPPPCPSAGRTSAGIRPQWPLPGVPAPSPRPPSCASARGRGELCSTRAAPADGALGLTFPRAPCGTARLPEGCVNGGRVWASEPPAVQLGPRVLQRACGEAAPQRGACQRCQPQPCKQEEPYERVVPGCLKGLGVLEGTWGPWGSRCLLLPSCSSRGCSERQVKEGMSGLPRSASVSCPALLPSVWPASASSSSACHLSQDSQCSACLCQP